MRIRDVAFSVVLNPLLMAYGHEAVAIRQRMGKLITMDLVRRTDSATELVRLVNEDLKRFSIGVPLKAMFVEHEPGVEIDPEHAQFAERPSLVITFDVEANGMDQVRPQIH